VIGDDQQALRNNYSLFIPLPVRIELVIPGVGLNGITYSFNGAKGITYSGKTGILFPMIVKQGLIPMERVGMKEQLHFQIHR
jgi:hypothetical protein